LPDLNSRMDESEQSLQNHALREDQIGHDRYLNYRAELVVGRQSAVESYDKAIIAVTTVLLGLSLTFSDTGGAVTQGLFLAAWVALLLALSFTVVSLLLGHYAFNRAIRVLDENYDKDWEEAILVNPFSTATKLLNLLSAVTFVAGATLLAIASVLAT